MLVFAKWVAFVTRWFDYDLHGAKATRKPHISISLGVIFLDHVYSLALGRRLSRSPCPALARFLNIIKGLWNTRGCIQFTECPRVETHTDQLIYSKLVPICSAWANAHQGCTQHARLYRVLSQQSPANASRSPEQPQCRSQRTKPKEKHFWKSGTKARKLMHQGCKDDWCVSRQSTCGEIIAPTPTDEASQWHPFVVLWGTNCWIWNQVSKHF